MGISFGNSLLSRQHPAWMKQIEDRHRDDHHSSIQRNKVRLMGNEVPRPALRQLDSPVNRSNIDTDDGEDHGSEERDNRARERLEETTTHRATDEVHGADDEDGDGKQLEYNTGDHDVCTCRGIASDLFSLPGCHSAADGLYDEGDNVAGAKDPEVETWL